MLLSIFTQCLFIFVARPALQHDNVEKWEHIKVNELKALALQRGC